MICSTGFIHKWSKWHKSLGGVLKNNGYYVQQIGLKRRCVKCGWIEEKWLKSQQIIGHIDDKQ